MDSLNGYSETKVSDVTEISVSREEILAAKAEIRRAGSETYVKLVHVTHHPSARNHLRAIQGSETLVRIRDLFAWFYPLWVLFIPLALVFIAETWFALVVLSLLFLLLNSLQSEINLELGARLLVANRKLKASNEPKARTEDRDVFRESDQRQNG